MAWYPDLSPCDYFGAESARNLKAVGWLKHTQPFESGQTDRKVYEKLVERAKDPWQPGVSLGAHACDLCRFVPEWQGSKNLFVPAGEFLYVAPELITHYMNAHGYAPPREFCEAVLACPAMRSREYQVAILAGGASRLIQAAKLAQHRLED